MARCESKGKRAFYFKTSLLKPVYDLVEFSFKLPLERSVPVIFSSLQILADILHICQFGKGYSEIYYELHERKG
jgi:hypothetical protein